MKQKFLVICFIIYSTLLIGQPNIQLLNFYNYDYDKELIKKNKVEIITVKENSADTKKLYLSILIKTDF